MKKLIPMLGLVMATSLYSDAAYDSGMLPERYDGMTVAEVVALLPDDSYVLIEATGDIPESWPGQIKEVTQEDLIPEGKIRAVIWYATTDGEAWQRYYAHALDVYLNELGREPAFIYRRTVGETGVAYIPVMSLMLDPHGVVIDSSREWCRFVWEAMKGDGLEPPGGVRRERERRPDPVMPPGDFRAKPETDAVLGEIMLLGAVKHPGPVTLGSAGPTTLARLLLSTELEERANLRRIRLRRLTGDGERETQLHDIEAVLRTGQLERDIPLQDGDIVIVGERLITFQ
jgi:hypothetical protein